MKHLIGTLILILCGASQAIGANPYLAARDNEPVSAKFVGTEWGDELGADDLPLRARVVTTRLATMSWGSIFRIDFEDIISQAEEKRKISADYFIVTDDKIIIFSAEDMDAEVRKISALPALPEYEPRELRALVTGKCKVEENRVSGSEITRQGDSCTYEWLHNSGHSARYVWKKGVGLVEIALNSGARSDGFALKRVTAKAKRR